MISGFEHITQELTDYEKSLVPLFVQGFSKKIGKENAVTNKEIISKMSPKYKVSEARVRKIVNYIRTEGLLPGLIASSLGYYVTTDPVELAKYIDSLKQRANEITRVKESMQGYLRTLLKQNAA